MLEVFIDNTVWCRFLVYLDHRLQPGQVFFFFFVSKQLFPNKIGYILNTHKSATYSKFLFKLSKPIIVLQFKTENKSIVLFENL